MTISDLAAVVVHHRSYHTLPGTIAALLSDGVAPTRLLVVDNSEEPGRRRELEQLLPNGCHVIYCANLGYGSAVNRGASWHEAHTAGWQYLLVSTHEARPYRGCLASLHTALVEDPGTAVVGPVLVTGEDGDTVWSKGGYLTSVLGLPRHHGHLSPRSNLASRGAYDVSWLDGALLMFRRGILTQHPISETFFLYMEETDHHQGLRRHGWRVKISPQALAWQHSNGVPPFYLTRNIQIFQARNGSRFQTLVCAPYLMVYSIARDIVKRRGAGTWRPLLRGWLEGRPLAVRERAGQRRGVIVVNPLGGALDHYTAALRQHLVDAGVEAQIRAINEPSAAGTSRLTWLLHYVALLGSAGLQSRQRRGRVRVLVTWPVLGFWDLLLVKFFCGSSGLVVYHDPKPLVRSIGSGTQVSALVGRVRDRPGTLVHSEEAARAMEDLGLAEGLIMVAHPVLGAHAHKAGQPDVSRGNSCPHVRVLGQYKQDRDIDLLESLAAKLGADCEFEIVGRGWPTVRGWQVDSRFVAEDELDRLVTTSDALIIPYKRFYQSGIAIRALEHSVPVVGRAETSLRDLYGAESPLLVEQNGGSENRDIDAWAHALEYALSHGRAEASRALDLFHERAKRDWTSVAANGRPLPGTGPR